MTITEKRDFINNFCGENNCRTCRLRVGGWSVSFSDRNCLLINNSPEEDLDRAIAIINGEDDPVVKDDPVNHPSHYTDGKIEVIDFIEDKKLGFCLGNAVKYIARAGKKDPNKEIEDLKKARWYVERRIKELEEVG